jgi:DNA-binding transcriptional regulator LsrR (DeoR family)
MIHHGSDLRLITRVARLYYEERLTQTEVAHRLGLTQVAVSRLLKKADEYGIVRTTVVTPPGAFTELESLLEETFGLSQAIVGDAAGDSEESVLSAIGSAAAQFLESTLKTGEVIGISSWSTTLLSMVEHMHPVRKAEKCLVLQMLGGVGNPSAKQHANRLAIRLARFARPGCSGLGQGGSSIVGGPFCERNRGPFQKGHLGAGGCRRPRTFGFGGQ